MIYTFYSYKGGVGRSMALANIAELFFQNGIKVLMVDWDLEAPGLERFFPTTSENILEHPGLIDMLLDYKRRVSRPLDAQSLEELELLSRGIEPYLLNIYSSEESGANLWIIPAGKRSGEVFRHYANLVRTFDWQDFYQNWEGELFFEWLRLQFERLADVVLIDSRTGVSEMGGVCTYQLADVVVMFCAPNQQSIEGTYDMASDFKRPEVRELRRGRSLEILVVPARVEDRAETELLNKARHQFTQKFSHFLPTSLGSREKLLRRLEIPHIPYYAFNENVAVREKGGTHSEDMVKAFNDLFAALVWLAPSEVSGRWFSSAKQGPQFSQWRGLEQALLTDYVDCDIEIQKRTGEVFPLMVHSAGGDASGTLRLPTNSPLYQRLASPLAALKPDENLPVQIGRLLFNTLFQGQVKEVFTRSREMLKERQKLRIKLNIAASEDEIAALPWELLSDPDQEPLASLDIPIVRYIPQSLRIPPLENIAYDRHIALPLKVLLTSAQTTPKTEVERELNGVQVALAELGENIHITIEPHLTPSKLQRLLRQGFHIWHFVGHGGFSQDSRIGRLYFEDASGGMEGVNATQIGIMLNRSSVRLIVLNACGNPQLASDPFGSIATALIRTQIPAVITMRFTVPEEATRAFASEFYRALAEGLPIDVCLTEGRKAVFSVIGPGRIDWGIPVIYTRLSDGKLFELPTPPPPILSVSSEVQGKAINSVDLTGPIEFEDTKREIDDLEHQIRERSFRAAFERKIGVIRSILPTPNPSSLPSKDEVIEAALWLWDQYDEDARETVVQSLVWVVRSGGRDQLIEKFKTGRSKERRLMRDSRLRDIAPDPAYYWYTWPSQPSETRLTERPDVSQWLELNELLFNPFGSGVAELDTLLSPSWAFPNHWDFIKTSRPTAILGGADYDRMATALMLRHELQSAVPQTTFIVWMPLPIPEIREHVPLHNYLRAVARSSGETWILLLGRNPGALFDLPKSDQFALAELFTWAAGSRNALQLRLHQSGLADDAEGRMLLRRLVETPVEAQQVAEPSQSKLLSWLGIRPPGLTYTYLIADCQVSDSYAQYQEQAPALLKLADNLAQAGVMLKLFAPSPAVALPSNVDTVPLAWEPMRLKDILSARIYHASGKRIQTFGDLFRPVPIETADDRLVEKAHRSLSKLLELGNAVIRAHVERDPNDPYLDETDLDEALRQSDGLA